MDQGSRYKCPHPDCNKSFTRQEHLSRHKLNHWPKKIFHCTYTYSDEGVQCSRTFVRKDLLIRHEKRHTNSGSRLQKKIKKLKSGMLNEQSTENTPDNIVTGQHLVVENEEHVQVTMDQIDEIISDGSDKWKNAPNGSSINSFFTWLFDGDQSLPDIRNNSLGISSVYSDSYMNTARSNHSFNSAICQSSASQYQQCLISNSNLFNNLSFNTGITMEDIFSIDLLNDDSLQGSTQQLSFPKNMGSSMDNHSLIENSGNVFPPKNLKISRQDNKFNKDDLAIHNADDKPAEKKDPYYTLKILDDDNDKISHSIPSFFYPDHESKYQILPQIYQQLVSYIPNLSNISIPELQDSLKSYWLNFHPQYPILHKPSFNVNNQPIILLLSLLMMGASYIKSENRKNVSDVICEPLRWIIFSHEDFLAPSKTYIIQSLLLLECYEKTSTNRYLHERSYLHHGTTIQLLRRTPSLGGHPLRFKNENPFSINNIEHVYHRWIDFEMLKRTAFYAFYIDTTHAVIFGYTHIFLNCNQIQLPLPCSDKIWECYDLSYEALLKNSIDEKSTSFLDALKRLINNVIQIIKGNNPEPFKLTSNTKFGGKILLAGIISIMFELQQQNEGINIFQIFKNDINHQAFDWETVISMSIDYWEHNILESCQNPNNSTLSLSVICDESTLRKLKTNDFQSCKVPSYHMSQIILRIIQYDYYIFAGAPWRMNVKAERRDYDLVSKRIQEFSQEKMKSGMAIFHCYQFLFEMFNYGENSDYNANLDYCITRPNTIALVSLLIWSYSFSLFGPEVQLWNNNVDETEQVQRENQLLKANYIPKEPFNQHLRRMYGFLKVDRLQSFKEYRKQIEKKALYITEIPNKNYLCGFMQHMRDIFQDCYWELGREFSRLFDNCLERSLGRQRVTCDHMYNT